MSTGPFKEHEHYEGNTENLNFLGSVFHEYRQKKLSNGSFSPKTFESVVGT